ncbi:MAG: NAD(P)/FAD-dependent oxidoreductase [Myxococcales bacterium]|nr:NAD(P)/FAD-dependent oxidoreductase [Myxococcales bacterium]MCB9569931.1 NAD(P)/FAD-dependent oxidoreductase [Myxococcales bacterium]MCB9706809.1 NAD(P)/FAD-dependent oxidoreductase [Myxococcales bacterium]
MRKPKVVIVGAGPSGSACALALSMAGQAEVVLLDKSCYPRVKVCGSGLSPHALAMLSRLQLIPALSKIHGRIRAMTGIGPGGGKMRLSTGRDAWVVPRVELDQTIAQTAVAFGADFHEETKGLELLRDPDGTVRGLKTDRGDFEADLVVCADGSPSRFSIDDTPKTTIRTLMGWWRGTSFPEEEAIFVWDERLHGYYTWVFPETHGIFNIGLTIPETAPDAKRLKELFQDLLDRYFADGLVGAEQVGKWMGHPAVITNKIGTVAESRAIWVGESARLVSPGSVEGISFALESGMTAAFHIGRHFGQKRGFSPLAIRGYQALTGARMLPKFWAGEGFARAVASPALRGVGGGLLSGPLSTVIEKGVKHLLGNAGDVA